MVDNTYRANNTFFEDKYVQFTEVGLPFPETRGALWSWGTNLNATLGLGDSVHRSSPVQVGTLTTWSEVATEGFYVAHAISSNGSLWTWGSGNVYGEIGLNGSPTGAATPVQIGALTNWSKISTTGISVISLKTDGTIWTWGQNGNGELGLGDRTHRSSPTQVGSLTNWSKVYAAGPATSASGNMLAVKTDGTLWAWGVNTSGQLGLGDTTSRSSPVQVGALTNWKEVSGGNGFSIAIKTDGTLWAWGSGGFGSLGLGNTTSVSSPVQVGSLTDWNKISSYKYHTLAIKTDGTMWSWGYNFYGSLGLGDRVHRSSPVQVGALTNWKEISTGEDTSAAIKTDGTLWTWGDNTRGVLGLGDTTGRSSPVQVGSLTNWIRISIGYSGLAIRDFY